MGDSALDTREYFGYSVPTLEARAMTIPKLRAEIRRRIASLDKLRFEAFKRNSHEKTPLLNTKKLAYENILRITYQK